MPKRIAEDHKQFRDIVTGKVGQALKDALASGQLFHNRSASNGKIPITIPRVQLPNFSWNGSQYSQDQEQVQPKKKPKLWRSIEEPFEPGW